jgi:hypothetical protein
MSLEDGQVVERHVCYPCMKYPEVEQGKVTAEILEIMTPQGEIKYKCGRGMNNCSVLAALMKK